MKLEDIFNTIESPEFSGNLNVVSSERAFFRAARRDDNIKALYEAAVTSANVRERLFSRLQELSILNVDPQYENPNDVALAILLLVLSQVDLDSVEAARLVERTPQCWYAKKLAQRILASKSIKSGNAIMNAGSDPTSHARKSGVKEVALSIGATAGPRIVGHAGASGPQVRIGTNPAWSGSPQHNAAQVNPNGTLAGQMIAGGWR